MSISRLMVLSTTIVTILVITSSLAYLSNRAPALTSCSASNACDTSTGSETLSRTFSSQGVNQTVIATASSTLAASTSGAATLTSSPTSITATASSTNTTVTLTAASQSSPSGGTFTYSPTSAVKILSVSAEISSGKSGNRTLSFSVTFQNIGDNPVYVVGGGGSSLSVISFSGSSVANQTQKIRCEIAEAVIPVNPGENHTSYTPGCWSGYTYVLMQPGTIQVQMSLFWSSGSQLGPTGTTKITAEFTLS